MAETIEGGSDLVRQILVARRELIAEEVEDGEVDLIGAVGIGGVNLRLDVGGVVEEQVEDVVALMLIGANDAGIDRDVVGHQGVGDDALLQTEVLGRMAGIDGSRRVSNFWPSLLEWTMSPIA